MFSVSLNGLIPMQPLVNYAYERWECTKCAKVLDDDEISDDWRCKACAARVSVYVKNGSGQKKILNRVKAGDVRVDARVIVSMSFDYIFPVIRAELEGDRVYVAFKAYRGVRFGADELLDCVIGEW